MPDPQAKFGSGTIEGAFNDDIEASIEHDEDIVITTDEKMSWVDRLAIGTMRLDYDADNVVRIGYELRAPTNLQATQGENVVVSGHDFVWCFTDVSVPSQTDTQTIIETEHIERTSHNA